MSFSIDRFRKALGEHDGVLLERQPLFRCMNSTVFTRFGSKNPLDSRYSFERGYRFNYKKEFPAIYASYLPVIAALEVEPVFDPLEFFRNEMLEPKITIRMQVTGRFADLASMRGLKELSLDQKNPEYLIATEVWDGALDLGLPTVTHQIGKAIYDVGFDGLLYLSYPGWLLQKRKIDIRNACIFMSLDFYCKPRSDSCKIEVIDPDGFFERITRP